jgi:prepilin peptidase CpaA
MISYVTFLLFPFLVLMGGFYDVLSYRIPNILSVLLIGGFCLFAVVSGLSMGEIGAHFLAGGVVLAVTFTLFSFGLLGGGDAKLMSSIALWIGVPFDVMLFLVYMSLFGGVLSIFIVYLRSIPALPEGFTRFQWIRSLHAGGGRHARNVPYAVAIAAGLLTALPQITLFQKVMPVL